MTQRQFLGSIVAITVIAAGTAVLKIFGSDVNHTTVALLLLLIVLFVATSWGSKPAILASVAGVVCFNFFFLPPIGTFRVADPENWTALVAFLITAMTAGQLSSRAKRRAEDANSARREIERLYQELQDTFEKSTQARALKQSERLKSALLDAITHDLRTPLTSIKASVTTLLSDERSIKNNDGGPQLGEDGRREMLAVIDEEADRLDRFIEDLMALARIGAGELQLRREWSSLAEIITAAMKRATALTKAHRIEMWLSDDLPSVPVDERAVAEVIYALVENAVKYSPHGGLIRITTETGSANSVHLVVEDQGAGIPTELRDRVFDKFFRATQEGDQRSPFGTGMGLAIANGIVEAHGGRIWIEDGAEGVGTRFVVALPTAEGIKVA